MPRSNRYTTIKYCAYALLLLGAFVLQNARGTAITLWGVTADVLPFLVASVALLEGPYVGGTVGFFAGLLQSVHSIMVEGLAALSLMLLGALFGWLSQRHLRPVLPSALLGGGLWVLLQGISRYIFYYALVYGVDFVSGLRTIVAPLALSLIPGAVLFWATRGIYRRFTETEL